MEALRRDRDEQYDRFLRESAEFQNYRKRVERERREQADAVTAEIVRDLLPIIDNFERALRTPAGPGSDAYRKGVEIIHEQMLQFLAKRGVTTVEAIGTHDF